MSRSAFFGLCIGGPQDGQWHSAPYGMLMAYDASKLPPMSVNLSPEPTMPEIMSTPVVAYYYINGVTFSDGYSVGFWVLDCKQRASDVLKLLIEAYRMQALDTSAKRA